MTEKVVIRPNKYKYGSTSDVYFTNFDSDTRDKIINGLEEKIEELPIDAEKVYGYVSDIFNEHNINNVLFVVGQSLDMLMIGGVNK